MLSGNISSKSLFAFPISLSVEPIKQLYLANFKNDPEFEIIELQSFDDEINGKGLRVLLYRKDKKVDAYWQTGVHFDAASFKIGMGLGNVAEVQFSKATLNINDFHVNIDVSFIDFNGRKVEFIAKENTHDHKRFPFLAPVGNDILEPNRLFFVYMQEFDFVKRNNTVIKSKIGDRELSISKFPVKCNKQKVYFARYASKLSIGEINKSPAKLDVAMLSIGLNKVGDLNLLMNNERRISNIWIDYCTSKLEMTFEPAFPNLLEMQQNLLIQGKWEYKVSDIIISGGIYSIKSEKNIVNLELNVTEKWKPQNIPFAFKAFTFIARFFRTWPTTYKWNAIIDINNNSIIKEGWSRKNIKNN